MEKDSDASSAPRHGREHGRLPDVGVEDETIPLDDVGSDPGENVPVDDV